MKRILVALLIGLTLGLSLTGCISNKASEEAVKEETDTEEKDKEKEDTQSEKKEEKKDSDKADKAPEETTLVVSENIGFSEGTYESDEAELVIAKNGSDYKIGFTVFRQCNLELSAYALEGKLMATGSDPAEAPLKAEIREEDGQLVFELTETTWTYFEVGQQYRFDPK